MIAATWWPERLRPGTVSGNPELVLREAQWKWPHLRGFAAVFPGITTGGAQTDAGASGERSPWSTRNGRPGLDG
jgi:hypothetical protein